MSPATDWEDHSTGNWHLLNARVIFHSKFLFCETGTAEAAVSAPPRCLTRKGIDKGIGPGLVRPRETGDDFALYCLSGTMVTYTSLMFLVYSLALVLCIQPVPSCCPFPSTPLTPLLSPFSFTFLLPSATAGEGEGCLIHLDHHHGL